MTLTKRQLLIGTVILVIMAYSLIAYKTTEKVSAVGPFATNLGYTATTTANIGVAGSTRILATSTNPSDPTNSYNRVYASICNPSANLVYLRLDGDKRAASTTATTIIGAAAGYNVCYEITDKNMYNGSVQASSTVSSLVNVSEYVQ